MSLGWGAQNCLPRDDPLVGKGSVAPVVLGPALPDLLKQIMSTHVYGWVGKHLLIMEQPNERGAPWQGAFLAPLEVPRWGCEIWRSVERLFCALSRMVFPISLRAPRTAESSQPLRPPAQLSNCRLPLGRHLLHPK